MSKFISHLHLDGFFSAARKSELPTDQVLSALAFPLSVLSALLLLDGALSTSITSAGIGILGLIAARAIKTRGR